MRLVTTLRECGRSHAIPLLVLWTLVLIAYSNSFRSGFVMDNEWVILRDTRVQSVNAENLGLILTWDYAYQNSTSGLYRPFTTLTYLLNYAVLGNADRPAGYHLVNLLLHAVNVSLIYALGLVLFANIRIGRPALALAAVWAVHPILTESVTNIVGRADMLAGLGILAALLCHIRAAASGGEHRRYWIAGIAAASTLAIFSKESAVVLPVVLLLFDLSYRPAVWRTRTLGYLAVAPGFAAYFVCRAYALARNAQIPIPFTDNPLVGADFWTARVTDLKVIGKYVWLLLWPAHLSCDYSFNQIAVWSSSLGVAFAVAACLTIASLALIAYRRNQLVFFGLAFFFVTLIPTANVVILIGTIMAERFLYLPSIGLLVVVIWLLYTTRINRFAPVAVTILCLALAVRTYARNEDWLNASTLWTSAVETSPNSYKTHINLAPTLAGPNGEGLDRAAAEAGAALAILATLPDDRNSPQPYAIAGFLYGAQGDMVSSRGSGAAASEWYDKALDVLLRGERIDRAALAAVRAPGRSVAASGWYPLYLQLGDTWLRLKEPNKALAAFEYGKNIRAAPEFFEDESAAWQLLGDSRRAAIALLEGLLANPNAPRLAERLLALYRASDPQGCSIRTVGNVAGPNPDCPAVHDQLCVAAQELSQTFRRAGRDVEAAALSRQAQNEFHCAVQ
jgi:hypothetical protein